VPPCPAIFNALVEHYLDGTRDQLETLSYYEHVYETNPQSPRAANPAVSPRIIIVLIRPPNSLTRPSLWEVGGPHFIIVGSLFQRLMAVQSASEIAAVLRM